MPRADPAALTRGYAFGLVLDAGLLLVAVLVALLVLRPTPRGEPDPLRHHRSHDLELERSTTS